MGKRILTFESYPWPWSDADLINVLLELSESILLILDEGLGVLGASRGARDIFPPLRAEEGFGAKLGDLFTLDDPSFLSGEALRIPVKGKRLEIGPGVLRGKNGRRQRAELSFVSLTGPGAKGACYVAQMEVFAEATDHGILTPWVKPGRMRIDEVTEPILIVRNDNRTICDVNQGFCRRFGWSRDEILGMSSICLHESGDSWLCFGKNYQRSESETEINKGIWPLRCRSGSLMPYRVILVDLGNRDASVSQSLVILLRTKGKEFVWEQHRPGRPPAEPEAPCAEGRGEAAELAVSPDNVDLTRRQKEVVFLLAKGLSSKEIGRILGISESTVKNHLSYLYHRFGTSSRIALLNRLEAMTSLAALPDRI